MRDNKRINAEIKLACQVYGVNHVLWAPDGSWIKISAFPLPPNLNMKITEIIIIFPEQYGYGAPLRDCFVNPDLKAWNPKTNQLVELPHYYQQYPYTKPPIGSKEEFVRKQWRYLCIHEKNWHPQKSNIVTFLQYVNFFLSDPLRDWKSLFESYETRKR